MNLGIEAVRKLAGMGYRWTVTGESIKARYEGPVKPDPSKVVPLLEVARQHKDDVRYFLRSYCPRCGGCCFIGKLCMACDWLELVEIYPDLQRKH